MSSLISPFTTVFSRLFRGARANPERDWAILLICAALALVAIVGWNVWAFETVVGGGTLGASQKPVTTTTATSALDTLPDLLSARANEDAKYIDGAYRFADPAL